MGPRSGGRWPLESPALWPSQAASSGVGSGLVLTPLGHRVGGEDTIGGECSQEAPPVLRGGDGREVARSRASVTDAEAKASLAEDERVRGRGKSGGWCASLRRKRHLLN